MVEKKVLLWMVLIPISVYFDAALMELGYFCNVLLGLARLTWNSTISYERIWLEKKIVDWRWDKQVCSYFAVRALLSYQAIL
jgi:hypothetical protein